MITGTGLALSALAVMGCLILLIAALRDYRVLGVIAAIMLLLVASGVPEIGKFRVYTNWLAPLGARRTELLFSLALLLLVGMAAHVRRFRAGMIPVHGSLLVLIGIYAGMLRIVHESLFDGIASIALVAVTVIPLMLTSASLAADEQGSIRIMRLLVWVGFVWVGEHAIQFIINPQMLWAPAGSDQGMRFCGMTNNPNGNSIMSATIAASGIWLIFNLRRGLERWIVICLVIACLGMLLLTGSRTGIAFFLIVAAAVTYRRIGRAILLAPVLGLAIFVVFKLAKSFGQSRTTLDRIASFDDTRSAAWQRLWATGTQNPLFGAGIGAAEASENSYLFGFASFGIGMVILLILQTIAGGVIVLRLWRARPFLGPVSRHLAELTIGFNAAYFAGAMLEGYMFGRVSLTTTLFVIFAGIAGALLLQAKQNRELAGADGVDGPAHESDSSYDYGYAAGEYESRPVP